MLHLKQIILVYRNGAMIMMTIEQIQYRMDSVCTGEDCQDDGEWCGCFCGECDDPECNCACREEQDVDE